MFQVLGASLGTNGEADFASQASPLHLSINESQVVFMAHSWLIIHRDHGGIVQSVNSANPRVSCLNSYVEAQTMSNTLTLR